MEKRKATYDLQAFKAAAHRIRVTAGALQGAGACGIGRSQITDIIQTMQPGQFYKSMTSYENHRVWHDVYHVQSEAGILYVKFTADAVTEFVLLSFKEKGND